MLPKVLTAFAQASGIKLPEVRRVLEEARDAGVDVDAVLRSGDWDALHAQYDEGIRVLSKEEPFLAFRLRNLDRSWDRVQVLLGAVPEAAASPHVAKLRELLLAAVEKAVDKAIRELAADLPRRQRVEVLVAFDTDKGLPDEVARYIEEAPKLLVESLGPRGRRALHRAWRAEVPANVMGILTAELGYDAAFDRFLPCSSREEALEAVRVGGPALREWESSGAWEELGWGPNGAVRGAYWTEVSEDGQQVEVHGVCDVDGDGVPAHYRIRKGGPLERLTPGDVF